MIVVHVYPHTVLGLEFSRFTTKRSVTYRYQPKIPFDNQYIPRTNVYGKFVHCYNTLPADGSRHYGRPKYLTEFQPEADVQM